KKVCACVIMALLLMEAADDPRKGYANMMFSVQPQMRAKIIQQYKEYMASYPQKQEEVEAFLQGKAESYCLCLQFLYGHMPVNDILSFPV
ncbi:MAG: hypothetical protein IKY59_03580, partial [Oscillospiraceae bacterium]|nr:hypothetical protein [Oscillospiraceae bacterium]